MTSIVEGTELVTTHTTGSLQPIAEVRPKSFFNTEWRDKITLARDIATQLKDVVEKQELFSNIGGKKYVRVEGWTTLGALLGILPREVSVSEAADGTYEATVELYDPRADQIVGRASAICGTDEKTWAGRNRFARRSMAITRATGKAYRLGFSWIMPLAGYQPTPAEEMPEDDAATKPVAVKQKDAKSAGYSGTTEQQKFVQDYLVKNGITEDRWPYVHERLMGRPSSELANVIKEMQ